MLQYKFLIRNHLWHMLEQVLSSATEILMALQVRDDKSLPGLICLIA